MWKSIFYGHGKSGLLQSGAPYAHHTLYICANSRSGITHIICQNLSLKKILARGLHSDGEIA
jgi:hypothetical protein